MKLYHLYSLVLVLLFACKKDEINYTITPKIAADQVEVKAESTVRFNDESEGIVSQWYWEFEGGDPATSELSSPEVYYAQPGTYSVKLVVKNANFETSILKESFISVGYNNVAPDFEFDKNSIIQNESIQFTDLTTGLPTEWTWTFTNENDFTFIATGKNPLVKFEEPGTYTVTLLAKNPVSQDSIVKEEVISVIDLTAVSADFKASTTGTYTGASVQFTDLSIGLVENREWVFEGGAPATSTEANPVVTYAAPGRYKVKLIASNSEKSSTKEVEEYILVVPGQDIAMFIPFNNGIQEAGPNAMLIEKTGTIDTSSVADRNGVLNSTATFSGTQGLVVKSEGVLNLGLKNFSVSVWVKTSSTTRMTIWQESGKNQTGDNQSWLRIGDNTTDRRMRFNTEAPSGGNIVNIGANGDIKNGVWRHVVCVREGTSMKVYVDKVLVGSLNTAAVRDVTGAQDFKIAFQEGPTSFSNYFIGSLDDFIIYYKALTATEIEDLYDL